MKEKTLSVGKPRTDSVSPTMQRLLEINVGTRDTAADEMLYKNGAKNRLFN
jgi:hypothetical protein